MFCLYRCNPLMRHKISNSFLYSAAVILALTALAKLHSAAGIAPVLDRRDPVLMLTHRQVFMLVGLLELAVAAFLFVRRSLRLKLGLTAWLASNFLIYRFALWYLDAPKTCGCLGNITDMLHIAPATAHNLMSAVMAYLLIGSYGLLACNTSVCCSKVATAGSVTTDHLENLRETGKT